MAACTPDDVLAALTQPGSLYATTRTRVDGAELRVFEHIPQNLGQYYELAAPYADRTFLVYEDERLTFAETLACAHQLAHRLRSDYGVQRGERVALAMRNYPQWCVAYMAVTTLGAVVVPLNAWWKAAELEFGLRDSCARVLIADYERFGLLRRRLPELDVSVLVARPTGELPSGVADLAPLLEGEAPAPAVEVSPDDDATLLYTSGSMGEPKGVVSTHRAVLSAIFCWELQVYTRLLPELPAELRERVLRWAQGGSSALQQPSWQWPQGAMLLGVPLFHVTGCNVQFLPCFRSGRKLVLMHRWNAERALQLIERERITDFTGVPTMSWELVNSPDFNKRDTSSLRLLGSGGAARPAEHVQRLKRKSGVAPSSGYGLTETNAVGSAIAGAEYEARPDSAGRALQPLVELKIVDSEGRHLQAGQEGEICIRSAANMRGYWKRPEETAKALREGWLHTGDLGRLDAEGYLYITGRAKDIVIRGGENISCGEIERVLYEHPSVFEVAAYGVPDKRLGEALAVSVMLRPDGDATAEELTAHVASRLAKFKVPSHILLQRERLPRLASGKFDKRTLAARLSAELQVDEAG